MDQNKYRAFVKAFDLRIYVAEVFPKYEKASNELLINCIYHEEDTPSLSIGKELFHCYGCGKSGNSITFLCDLTHRPAYEVIEENYRGAAFVAQIQGPAKDKKYVAPSNKIIDISTRILWRNPDKLQYFRDRGLWLSTINKYQLGYYRYPTSKYDKPRFTIPVKDKDGNLVTIRYRRDDLIDCSKSKYLVYPRSRQSLYNLSDLEKSDRIVMAGSQIDALLLSQYGVPSIGPASENVFLPEWTDLLRDKQLYILYDNDKAGRLGAEKIHSYLPSSVILGWPKDKPNKYDISDAYKEHGIEWLKDMFSRTPGLRTIL